MWITVTQSWHTMLTLGLQFCFRSCHKTSSCHKLITLCHTTLVTNHMTTFLEVMSHKGWLLHRWLSNWWLTHWRLLPHDRLPLHWRWLLLCWVRHVWQALLLRRLSVRVVSLCLLLWGVPWHHVPWRHSSWGGWPITRVTVWQRLLLLRHLRYKYETVCTEIKRIKNL